MRVGPLNEAAHAGKRCAQDCGREEKIRAVSYDAAIDQLFKRMRSSRAISTFCESGDSQRAANKILWPPRLRRLRWGIRTICEFE